MPEAASVLIGPAEMALTRICSLAEIGGEIAHAGFQRRLGHAHHVVVRHHPLGAEIGERQQAAAVRHQVPRALRHRGEGVAGDVQRLQEVVARGVDVLALQLLLVGEGDGMDHEIERAPAPASIAAKVASMLASSVTSQGTTMLGADRLRQRPHALLQRLALIGEGELRALASATALAMPQAIERSLATPMIRPRLPAIRPLLAFIELPTTTS